MRMFRASGGRTRRLLSFLRRRARTPATRRGELDLRGSGTLFRKRAIVYTDTADFTVRTVRDGILHFLMVFDQVVSGMDGVVRRQGGEILKVEADSLLMRFDDPKRACRAVQKIEAFLRHRNRSRPANEQLRFSYGIGYGDVLDLDGDVFGLEVNLASKLGEDLARPGEALLTSSATQALDARTLREVVPHRIVTLGQLSMPVHRLKLGR
jgi:class 3 adenylate cyclase